MSNDKAAEVLREKAELMGRMRAVTEHMASLKHDCESILADLPIRQRLMERFDQLPRVERACEEDVRIGERMDADLAVIIALNKEIAECLAAHQNSVLDDISRVVREKKRLAKRIHQSADGIGRYFDTTQ